MTGNGRAMSRQRKQGTSLACAAGSFVALILVAGSLFAQKPTGLPMRAQASPIQALGTEGFQAILGQYGLKPIKDFAELEKADPKRTIIIAFRGSDKYGISYSDRLNEVRGGVKAFVDHGGAVFFASDQSTKGGWAGSFDAQVFGTQLEALGDAGHTESYHRNPVCPFLKPAREGQIPNLFHVTPEQAQNLPEALRNQTQLTRVATNRPSYLAASSELETIAEIAPACQDAKSSKFVRGPIRFAQAKWYPESHGKILVMADHSVF
ncbi:MAG TPA: hypothetical protein VKS79_08540, partial [Gemmataceae bacterium]|nr:hypothetical protein [Gemmataceae bacterium]